MLDQFWIGYIDNFWSLRIGRIASDIDKIFFQQMGAIIDDLINNHPYEYTQEDIQFKTYLLKNNIECWTEELREEFFSKPKACFRASPLVKKYGWGMHYNEEGKIALYNVSSVEYERLSKTGYIKVLKGMRTSRK